MLAAPPCPRGRARCASRETTGYCCLKAPARNVLLRHARCARDIGMAALAAEGRTAMADYSYDFVNVKVRDGIAWAALNRPEKRNAMSPALHYEMDDALARLEVDDAVKVVVVTGEGGNFSAGQDLKKFFRELDNN